MSHLVKIVLIATSASVCLSLSISDVIRARMSCLYKSTSRCIVLTMTCCELSVRRKAGSLIRVQSPLNVWSCLCRVSRSSNCVIKCLMTVQCCLDDCSSCCCEAAWLCARALTMVSNWQNLSLDTELLASISTIALHCSQSLTAIQLVFNSSSSCWNLLILLDWRAVINDFNLNCCFEATWVSFDMAWACRSSRRCVFVDFLLSCVGLVFCLTLCSSCNWSASNVAVKWSSRLLLSTAGVMMVVL